MVDLSLLHPVVQAQAEALIKLSPVPIKVTQAFRTREEQQALYNQGRTNPGNIVTYAKPGFSMHEFGVAFDVVGTTINGGITYDIPWQELADIASSLGLEWGGRWKTNPDKPHFQWLGGQGEIGIRNGLEPKRTEEMLAYIDYRVKGIYTNFTRFDDPVDTAKLALILNRLHDQIL